MSTPKNLVTIQLFEVGQMTVIFALIIWTASYKISKGGKKDVSLYELFG